MVKIIRFQIFVLLLLISVLSPSYGETNKTIQAVKTSSPPIIDGELDDVCWQKAAKVSDFIQHEPVQGAKATESTTVYLLFDKDRLYVAFECFQSDMEKLQASATRRDSEFWNDDYVEVFLDTFHDKRNCYAFAVNLLSAQADRRIANEGQNQGRRSGGKSWDCDWYGKAAKGDGKWMAEISIPFSELRFKKKADSVWGINFRRNIESIDESDTWADTEGRRYAVSRFGELVGLPVAELATTRPLELKPYVVTKPRKPSAEEPWEWKVYKQYSDCKRRGDVGLDVRYPFSTITLDLTLNPDYAQIEADPARINLSDVPYRLAEKRPFFQEGCELFRTPIDIFYTREISDPLVGLKAVGKMGNYNVACLDVQAEREPPEEEDEPVECENDQDSRKGNNFFVFRAQRDVGERSTVGILGVNKQKQDGGYNRAAGLDANTTLPSDIRLSAQYAFTKSPQIDNFSRADAFQVRCGRRSDSVSFDFRYRDIGQDFDAEAGFVPESRIDRLGPDVDVWFQRQFKSRLLRRIGGGIEYQVLFDHDGNRTNERREIGFNISLWDFWTRCGFEWYFHPGDEDEEDRTYIDRTFGMFGGYFPSKWVTLMTPMRVGKVDGKDAFFIGPEFTLKPTDDIALSMEIQRLKQEDEVDINRRFTLEYRFTQRMHFRGSVETTSDNANNIFALYSWEFQPESNFFLVYTFNEEEGETAEHTFFVKVAYLMKWKF